MKGQAIGYIRVSTKRQTDEGISIEMQEPKILAAAELKDLEVKEIMIDAGHSAGSLRRPGLQRALRAIKGEVSAIIVYKLDRLTRSVQDLWKLLELLEKNGVALISVTESLDTSTASGRLVMNVMASVAQWEREIISERTRDALQHLKAEGRQYSGISPYGYNVIDGKLYPVQKEQDLMQRMGVLYSSGHSYRGIAKLLNEEGVTTRSGSHWRHQYVMSVLMRYWSSEEEDLVV